MESRYLPRLPRSQEPKTPDAELADHLKHAENHLIEAVKLFEQPKKPKRGDRYLQRLTTAQETVTSLYGEELVRIRGPQRPPRLRNKRVKTTRITKH